MLPVYRLTRSQRRRQIGVQPISSSVAETFLSASCAKTTPFLTSMKKHLMSSSILHITNPERWTKAQVLGEYRADSLASEGFIQCSKPDQLAGVVSRYYQDQTGLIVLRIDPGKVQPPIRWENPPGSNEQFPHIYGELNLNAVIEVKPLEEIVPS